MSTWGRDASDGIELRSRLDLAERKVAEMTAQIARLEATLARSQVHATALELTVQSTTTKGEYRLRAEWNRPGEPVTRERVFTLDPVALREASLNAVKYGRLLGEALFVGGVRDLFVQAHGEGAQMRVLLAIEAVEAQSWRWERLCAPFREAWRPLRTEERTPFSLYIPSTTDRRFPPFRQEELKALVVVASPARDNPKHAWFDEAGALDSVLQGLKKAGIESKVLSNFKGPSWIGLPTLTEVCRQLSSGGFTLLHMVCHGTTGYDGKTSILLNSDEALPLEASPTSRSAVVSASAFIERLDKLDRGHGLPHFAFLSVCESGAAREVDDDDAPGEPTGAPRDWRDNLRSLAHCMVKDLGVKSVIAMTDRISQTTALALGREFYPLLKLHGEADVALAKACIAVDPRHDVLSPTLFSRVVGHRLFAASAAAAPTDAQLEAARARLEALFVERAPVLLQEPRPPWTRDWLERHCERVLEVSFAELARGEKEPPEYHPTLPPPFPGLRAFTSAQRGYFRGRDALVSRLVERLKAQPFVCVLGNSGSGKSSLVAAGVIPALAEKNPGLRLERITPGATPVARLEEALARLAAAPGAPEALLYIDQFEEVFTLCETREMRKEFLDRVAALARPECRVIMTMRADLVGECTTHPGLHQWVQQQPEFVAAMTPGELRNAVEEQAREAGLRFESGLLEAIFHELDDAPGAMPLLQHALAELWERRHGRWLRLAAWKDEIGGVKGAIEKTAEDVWSRLEPEDKQLLPGVMRKLAHVGQDDGEGGGARDTRARVPLAELAPRDATPEARARVEGLVNLLAGGSVRLLMIGADERVEVVHEALLRHWARLVAWINEARRVKLVEQDLRKSTREWLEHGKARAYLEHRNVRADAVDEMRAKEGLELDEATLCVRRNPASGEGFEAASVKDYFEACKTADQQDRDELLAAEQQLKRQVAAFYQEKGLALKKPGDAYRTMVLLHEALKLQGYTPSLRFHMARAAARSIDREVARIAGHNAAATAATLSADERHLVVGYRDGTVRRWDLAVAAFDRWGNRSDLMCDYAIEALRFSADQGLVIATCRDGRLLACDATNGGELEPFTAPSDEPLPEPSILGTTRAVRVTADGRVEVCDPRTEDVLVRLPERPTAMHGATFDPSAERVLTWCAGDAAAKIWDANTGAPVLTLAGHADNLVDASFGLEGERVLTRGRDDTATLWDARSGSPIATFAHEGRILFAGFSADRAQIITSDSFGCVRTWNARTGTVTASLDLGRRVIPAPTSAGTRGFAASEDNALSLLDLERGAPLATFQFDASTLQDLCTSPDGARVATSSEDRTVRLWSAETGELLASIRDLEELSRVAFSPDGAQLLVWSNDEVRLFDGRTGARQAVIGRGAGIQAYSVAFHPDERRVIVADRRGNARIFDSLRGVEIDRLMGHEWALNNAVYSGDGKRAATAHGEGFARVWRMEPRASLVPLGVGVGDLTMAAFSPDGAWVAAASEDFVVRVWATATGEEQAPITGHEERPHALAFSPDSRRLLTGDLNGKAWMCDARTGADLVPLVGHEGRILAAAYSPEEPLVVTVGDGPLRVWDASSGACLATFEDFSGAFTVAFVAGGTHIVSWEFDGCPHVRDLRTGWVVGDVDVAEASALLRATAFSPGGAFIAVDFNDATREGSLEDPEAGLMESQTRQDSRKLRTEVLASLAFTADGYGPRLWDARTGATIAELDFPDVNVIAARFSDDGKRLTTLGHDYKLRTIDVSFESRSVEELGRLMEERVPYRFVDGEVVAR